MDRADRFVTVVVVIWEQFNKSISCMILQVLPAHHPLPAHIQFPAQYSQFAPLSPGQVASKHGHYPPANLWFGGE